MRILKILLVFLSLNAGLSLSAQYYNVLTPEDKKEMENQANELMKRLEYSINKIPKVKNPTLQKSLIDQMLRDFTEDAHVEEMYGNGKTRQHKAKDYFHTKLPKYGAGPRITNIQFLSWQIDKIKKSMTEPNTYYIDFRFTQLFQSTKDGERDKEGLLKYKYVDRTDKEGRMVIRKKTTIVGSIWQVKIAYINAVSIEVL